MTRGELSPLQTALALHLSRHERFSAKIHRYDDDPYYTRFVRPRDCLVLKVHIQREAQLMETK